MIDSKNRISFETLFSQINKLKDNFTITPQINSISDLELFLDKEVTIKHNLCNNKQKIILRKWLNTKRNPLLQGENDKTTHLCKSCMNKLRKDNLQGFLNENYNGEFILVGEYEDYRKKIELKHIYCSDSFFRTPCEIKAKRIYCKHCGKSDSLYEKLSAEKRNQELKNKFEANNISSYIPLEDCPGLTKKMKFKHTTCGGDFESTAYDVYNNYFKHDHCPNCFKRKPREIVDNETLLKNSLIKIKNRYYRFLKFAEEFTFEPEICSLEDFKERYQDTFTITHKKCGRSVSLKLDEWTKLRNNVSSKNKSDGFLYLCPHCSEEIGRRDLQNFLNKKYNKEFFVAGKYINAKHPIDIVHNKCGHTFSMRPDRAKHKKIICKGCNSSDKKTEDKLQNKRNKDLLKKLKDAGLKDAYKPLEDCLGATKSMKFEHIRCGNIIDTTPSRLLRSKYKPKHYCEKCPEQLLATETNKALRTNYAQKAIDIINTNNKFSIVGNYDDNDDTVLLSHDNCLGEFQVSKRFLFARETKCPHCETNNYKNNRYISITEKIKLYEDELDNKYKILKPFIEDEETVPIKHLECGHIFDRTISSFLRSKGKLFCPKCRTEKRHSELLDKLNDKYNNDIDVCNMDDYKNVRTKLKFIHNKCGTVFESNFDRILDYKNMPCPKCNPETKTLEKLKGDVYKKFKGEYIVIGEFKGYTKKISFRHKKCERAFSKTPYEFFNSNIPCSHCLKEHSMVGMEEAQRRVTENSKGLFTLKGIYRGIKKEIPVSCNECGHIFMSTPKKMFTRKRCPNCKTQK